MLQVKASGSKVDNLIDKMRDHREGKIPQKEMDCMKKCMPENANDEMRVGCIKQCSPDVFCGNKCFLGVSGNPEEREEECRKESSSCYKCLDKCPISPNGAGAVAVTSFAVFSLAIASLMM